MSIIDEHLRPEAVARSIAGLVIQKDAREAEKAKQVGQIRESCEYELQDIHDSLQELRRSLPTQLEGTSRQGHIPEVGRNADGDVVFHWGRLSVRFVVTPLGVGWNCGEDTGLLRGEGAQLTAGQHALALVRRLVEQRPWVL
jgi:hypothetical protein